MTDDIVILDNKICRKPPFRPRRIMCPLQLIEEFVAYAEFVEETPFYEDKVLKTVNGIVKAKLRKDRPMTVSGFCVILGITPQAWRYWRKNRDDLAEAIEIIEGAIFAYKFERAAVGIFKGNIISRELGLGQSF